MSTVNVHRLVALAAVLQLLAIAALLMFLAGCGGGGDDEPDVPTPAVDCKAKPELCK